MPDSRRSFEWLGRLLVLLQFGLLAWMGMRLCAADALSSPLVLGLLAASAGVGLWALYANRPGNFNIRPTPRAGGELITEGPYRWIRHPMYTAVLLAGLAAAAGCGTRVDGMLWAALLAVLLIKSRMEERALQVRFPTYQSYKAQTSRFVPWLI
jgi:protein-S-isoprenylcysteine O-methyltransferase Ste14